MYFQRKAVVLVRGFVSETVHQPRKNGQSIAGPVIRPNQFREGARYAGGIIVSQPDFFDIRNNDHRLYAK